VSGLMVVMDHDCWSIVVPSVVGEVPLSASSHFLLMWLN
jgi:hypothetical protein